MAGEIQLNSITMATESSGSITAELDTIRPNTTNGSLTLQGDSSDAGVTGLTIDSSGVVNLTTAKVTNIQGTSGQSLTIKDEDGNAAITIGTDNTAAGYLSLNFGSYHGDSGGAGGGSLSGSTLSDYEFGTWTPQINLGVTSITYDKQEGTYTKVGDIVTVSCTLAISAGSTNGSTMRISNFPFTSANLTDVAFLNIVKGNTLASNGENLFIYVNSSATTAFLRVQNSTGGGGFNGINFGSTGSLSFSLTYKTT